MAGTQLGTQLGTQCGAEIGAWRARYIGFLPQKRHLSSALTVADNLALLQHSEAACGASLIIATHDQRVVQAQGLSPITGWTWLPAEAGVPLLAAGVAALAALLPVLQAYRTEAADLLGQT